MNPSPASSEEHKAWNEAYERLVHFLDTFALDDRIQVSRLALDLVERSRQIHRTNPSRHPTTIVMEQAQDLISDWLASNLDRKDRLPSEILSSGYVALLLSRLFQASPTAFLTPLPGDLRQSLQQTLLVTGPDLNISSMTPRRFDYGPMLDLAQQTWHRADLKTVLLAILFWAGVYGVLYACFSNFL